MILRVHGDGDGDLPLVVQAGVLPGFFPGFGKDREEDGRQDRDNRDHDEQLNEGEPSG
ncbi:MAG: hypothetical protein BWY76_02172 [bacterium ADurb.Bin429]|nr:MAG: hypothetical protein BWY76_02172 [bacterium ADurb.Bin429]